MPEQSSEKFNSDFHPVFPGSDRDVVVFDLETQFLAAEVGGWDNISKMKVSVGVTWSSRTGKFRQFTEAQVPELLNQLFDADIVVGFNNLGFDNTVLQPYSQRPLSRLKSLDLLAEIKNALGHRLKLDAVAKATLKRGKTGDGSEAVTLYRDGKLAELLGYCQADVELTRDLYLFGRQYGYLLYEDRVKGLKRIQLCFDRI